MLSTSTKKNIVFTVINDLTTDQRMHRICNSLQENGYEVLLVGRKLSDSRPLPTFAFKTKRLRCFFHRGKLFYLEYNILLFFFLLFRNFSIYGAVDLDTIMPNLAVAGLKNKPCSFDAHEYFTEVPEVYQRKWVKRVWSWVESITIPKTDLNYTVSESIADKYRSDYKVEFGVVRNIAPMQNVAAEKFSEKTIIYQGALNRGRGLEELLEAMPYIKANLLIVGGGDIEEIVKTRIEELNLSGKVSMAGKISPEELRDVTPKAHLGYNVLKNDGMSYYFSLANKCFDYLQAGIPVITSPFPEYLRLAAEHPFFVFSTANPEVLADKINALFADDKAYNQLLVEVEKAKQVLNWQMEEKKLLKMYQKI